LPIERHALVVAAWTRNVTGINERSWPIHVRQAVSDPLSSLYATGSRHDGDAALPYPNVGIRDPPTHIAPPRPLETVEELFSYARGEPLRREAFPEALYVFDRERFEKLGDLFAAGGFYFVKGKLAKVLSQFDLGQGGLIPLPIYQEDKVMPVAGEFYTWIFGAQKNAFLPE
jgi:hypothetical protein